MKQSNPPMTEPEQKMSSRILPFGINLISFGVFASTAILLRASVAPVRRGFFCDDISIKYPIVSQTVKTSVLLAVSFSVAAVLFTAAEYINTRRIEGRVERFRFFRLNVPVFILKTFKLSLLFVWGVVATSVLTDVIKVSLGYLRPNFMAICQPNVTCTDPAEFGIYHEDYVCQGISQAKENSARSSFPSGHASQAAFAAIFLILYTQKRLTGIEPILFLPCLHLSLISSAAWSAMTRISDYVHHPGDVLAGIVLGLGVGFAFGLQTLAWIKKTDLESAKKLEEERHLATLRSDIAEIRSPNGQV